MKILMANNNDEDRMIALFAFKKLNVAHSIDFVATSDELVQYLKCKLEQKALLPNLLLLDLNLPGSDVGEVLRSVRSNPSLEPIKTILFAISDLQRGYYVNHEEIPGLSLLERYDQEDLAWVFEEIYDELVEKDGWRYSMQVPILASRNNQNE